MTMRLAILGLAVGIWAAATKAAPESASLALLGSALMFAASRLRRLK